MVLWIAAAASLERPRRSPSKHKKYFYIRQLLTPCLLCPFLLLLLPPPHRRRSLDGVAGGRCIWLTEWVNPVGRAPEQAHQHLVGGAGRAAWGTHTGEAKRCPEASRRGDAKQPRRRAGRRAGAHRRGEEPPTSSADPDPVNAGRLRLRCSGGWKFYFNKKFTEALSLSLSLLSKVRDRLS
jgi:hypothetical protein